MQWAKELLQRELLENTELLIKNKNSSHFHLYATNSTNVLMSYLIFQITLHRDMNRSAYKGTQNLLKSSKLAW